MTDKNGIKPIEAWYVQEETLLAGEKVLFVSDQNREICSLPLEEDNPEANEQIRFEANLIRNAPAMFHLLKEFYTSREFCFDKTDIEQLDNIFSSLGFNNEEYTK